MSEAYIGASIINVRLLNENANVRVDNSSGRTLKMTDESIIESAWAIDEETGLITLAISPALNTVFVEEATDTLCIDYASKHTINFNVFSHRGFDPQVDLPDLALKPYLDMALFLVRGRATASIRGMGVSNFVWPVGKFEGISEAGAKAVINAPQKKTARKAKPQKSTI